VTIVSGDSWVGIWRMSRNYIMRQSVWYLTHVTQLY